MKEKLKDVGVGSLIFGLIAGWGNLVSLAVSGKTWAGVVAVLPIFLFAAWVVGGMARGSHD